jgi:hypothetical protein
MDNQSACTLIHFAQHGRIRDVGFQPDRGSPRHPARQRIFRKLWRRICNRRRYNGVRTRMITTTTSLTTRKWKHHECAPTMWKLMCVLFLVAVCPSVQAAYVCSGPIDFVEQAYDGTININAVALYGNTTGRQICNLNTTWNGVPPDLPGVACATYGCGGSGRKRHRAI